ncbi:MAG TPA: SURF1 family protein [Marmoricola sp.]|nr:SURF1 family protein [Marmoricola sp.]
MSRLLERRYWGGHLLMVLALAASVLLGLWQLDVWQAHRTASAIDLTHDRPVPLSRVMGGDSPFPGDAVGKPVTFSGRWLPAGTVYVSGRLHDGRRGFWAVTPVVVGRSAMPVVRGWTPRAQAPDAHGQVRVTGWLEPSESQGEADVNPHDRVISSMRIASLVEHVDADLYSGFVIARDAGQGTTGLAAVPPPPSEKVSVWTGLRNFLYGLQWWVFGGLAVFMWWRWCQDQLQAVDEPGEAEPEDEPDRLPTPQA